MNITDFKMLSNRKIKNKKCVFIKGKCHRFITSSVKETIELGKTIAHSLKPGDIIFLYGELGSGKTVLTKGVCQGLGVTEQVTSSSFVIATEYKGRMLVSHIDLYRLSGKDVDGLPIEEYLPARGITIIEWAERLNPSRTQKSKGLRISLIIKGASKREILIEDLRS